MDGDKPELLVIGPYPPWDMEDLETVYRVHKLWEVPDRKAFLRDRGAAIRAIATRGELGAPRSLIDALPRLEIIACYGIGVDGIDLAVARERGIRVTNTPDVLTEDVADIAIGLLLAVVRRIPQADAYVRSGAWVSANMALTTRVFGKRLGIVGLGRIGAAVMKRALAFGMEIGYCASAPRDGVAATFFGDVADLAAWSDFMVVTVAGGAGTNSIIDARVLKALGRDGYLVNISRGTTVDEAALLDALEAGTIAGAGLDVFRNEPTVDWRFISLDNVVLQPHHASGTIETRRAMGRLMRANLAAHFTGLPLPTPVL